MYEIFHNKKLSQKKDSVLGVILSELESFSTPYYFKKCYLNVMDFISSFVKW